MFFYSLITGASGLLGRYHSEALLQINHNIVVTDKNLSKLKVAIKSLQKKYPKRNVLAFKMDVTSKKDILKVLNLLKKKKYLHK